MSLPAIRRGIYQHLATDGNVTALVGSRIYYRQAPADASLPYVVFERVSADFPRETGYKSTVQRWQIRAHAADPSAADSIADALDTALDLSTLSITGWVNFLTQVVGESEEILTSNGQQFYGRGIEVRILADKS